MGQTARERAQAVAADHCIQHKSHQVKQRPRYEITEEEYQQIDSFVNVVKYTKTELMANLITHTKRQYLLNCVNRKQPHI